MGSVARTAGGLELSLSLTLPNGMSGTHTGTFTGEEFREEWLQRWRCRRVWDDLLGVFLGELQRRNLEYLSEPAGV